MHSEPTQIMESELHIPRPTRTLSVSQFPNRADIDKQRWLALHIERSETDDTGTNDVTTDVTLPEEKRADHAIAHGTDGTFGRSQTILEGLEHSEIRNQPELKHKFLMFAMIPSLCVFAVYNLYEMKSAEYKIMSMAVAISFTAFVVYWLYLLATASQLHRIRLITTRFQPFYGNMIFPTQIKHYPSRPIKSTSELLALRGSSMHIFFVITAMAVSCVTAFAILLHWLDVQHHGHLSKQETFIDYLEEALAICSVFAMPMVGYFELDVHSRCLMVMHYIGVLCLALMVWPFAIQSEFSMISIVIIVVSYLSFAVWVGLGYYYPDDLSERLSHGMTEKEMRMTVHWMSLHCLLAQTLGTYGCGAGLSLYLWNIHDIVDL